MKAAQMEQGVAYAYQTERIYATPRPIVVLGTKVESVHFYRDFLHGFEDPIVTSLPGGGRRCAVNEGFGYVAVSPVKHNPSRSSAVDDPDEAIRRLLKVTYDEVAAMTIDDTAHHRHVPGHPGVYPEVIDPRYILGPWDVVWQAHQEEQEVEATLKAEAERRTEESIKRFNRIVDALAEHNVPGHHAHLKSGWRHRDPVESMRLTLGQVEALLSLVPEGAKVEEQWEYEHPEGRGLD